MLSLKELKKYAILIRLYVEIFAYSMHIIILNLISRAYYISSLNLAHFIYILRICENKHVLYDYMPGFHL